MLLQILRRERPNVTLDESHKVTFTKAYPPSELPDIVEVLLSRGEARKAGWALRSILGYLVFLRNQSSEFERITQRNQ